MFQDGIVPVFHPTTSFSEKKSPPSFLVVPLTLDCSSQGGRRNQGKGAHICTARTGSTGKQRARMALSQLPSHESLFPLTFLSD